MITLNSHPDAGRSSFGLPLSANCRHCRSFHQSSSAMMRRSRFCLPLGRRRISAARRSSFSPDHGDAHLSVPPLLPPYLSWSSGSDQIAPSARPGSAHRHDMQKYRHSSHTWSSSAVSDPPAASAEYSINAAPSGINALQFRNTYIRGYPFSSNAAGNGFSSTRDPLVVAGRKIRRTAPPSVPRSPRATRPRSPDPPHL